VDICKWDGLRDGTKPFETLISTAIEIKMDNVAKKLGTLLRNPKIHLNFAVLFRKIT
jgi:hypothetical protein